MFYRLIIVSLVSFVFLMGCQTTTDTSNENIEEVDIPEKTSETFQSGGYTMLGEKDRLGFIVSENETFQTEQGQKYMWHFWGSHEELDGRFKVLGTHEKGDKTTVVASNDLGGPNNGADAHTPSIMSLPKKGIWTLSAYVGDELFDTVTIEVE